MKPLRVLSLFDGISCGQLALERANIPVEIYWASEIEKNAIAVTNYHYGDTVQLGDVNRINCNQVNNVDLLIGGSPCFVGETLVLTNSGHTKIENVKIGDLVLGHDNKWHKVTYWALTGEKEVMSLQAMGVHKLEATENHKFYVRHRIKQWHNDLRAYKWHYDTPIWKELKDINKEYYLGYAINQESKIPKWQGVDCIYGRNYYTKHKQELPLSDGNLWYIVGRWLGDGWLRKNRKGAYRQKYNGVTICCAKNECEYLEEKIRKIFNCTVIKERTVCKIQIANTEFSTFLSQFGEGALYKFVPTFVMDLPVILLSSFLQGYFEADGYTNQKFWSCTSISEKLVYGIAQCVAKVYHRPCTISKYKRNKTCVIEGRVVNQHDTYTLRFKRSIDKQDKAFYEDGYLWLPIRKIEKTGEIKKVFDITVEDSHSFTANGIIVHNCQNFSFAGNRKGMYTKENVEVTNLEQYLNLKNNGFEFDGVSYLFWEYVRLLNEIKPKYFLLENVVMSQKWQDIISNTLGVEPIHINSRLVSAQDRKRLYWCNWDVTQPEDKNISFSDIVEDGWFCASMRGRRIKNGHRCDYDKTVPIEQHIECRKDNKSNCCTTVSKDNVAVPVKVPRQKATETEWRYLSPVEYERLQTLPDNYTDIIKSDFARRSLCGNGWTVDVIVHLLNCLKENGRYEK